jgi:L-ascorbate metabolism protein UlaG (beta-lactamase superfamily)
MIPLNAVLLITYLGTASFLFDFGETKLLTDPGDFFTERLTPEKARSIAGVDLICLTHAHFDHSNRLADIPNSKGIPVLAPETAKAQFAGYDLRTEEDFRFGDLRIRAYRTVHGVSHWEDHRSYLIEREGFRLCFLGDAYAVDPGFVDLAYASDLLFVTLGTFETNPENALRNIALLRPKRVVAMHWEALLRGDQKAREFAKTLAALYPSMECIVPEIGGTFAISTGRDES